MFDLLTYPISIIWDGACAASKASEMKRVIKVSITLMQRGPDVEVRLGFRNTKVEKTEYAVFLKRLYAEIDRKTRIESSFSRFIEGKE